MAEELVVVTIDGESSKRSPKDGKKNRKEEDVNEEDSQRISVVCDLPPKSPSPKKNSRSRGSSYNFSEDEKPLVPPNRPEEHDTGDGSKRNKSFDFGVSLDVQGENNGFMRKQPSSISSGTIGTGIGSIGSPSSSSNGGYYRLPREEDDARAGGSSKSRAPGSDAPLGKTNSRVVQMAEVGSSSEARQDGILLKNGQKQSPSASQKESLPKQSLRSVIAMTPEGGSSSADGENAASGRRRAAEIPSSTQSVSFRESKKKIDSPLAAAVAAEGVVLKAPTNFNRLKSKSRLADPPPPPVIFTKEPLVAESHQLSPGKLQQLSARTAAPEEEDDPLKDVDASSDLPEKYRRQRWGLCSWFQLAALLGLTGMLVCSITLNPLKKHSIWGLELWKWALMVLVVLSGRLLSGWIIHIVVFFIERNFLWRKRVLYFVYGLRRGVQTVLWLAMALVAWLLLFDPRVERSTRNHKALTYVTKVLVCFLIAAFVWLGKLLFVKVLASSYHMNTYFDRIQESLFNQYILEKLSGPPIEEAVLEQQQSFKDPPEEQPKQNQAAKVKKKESEGLISMERLQRMNQKNISAWNMKRLITLVKQSGISTLSQALDTSAGEEECKESEIQTEWQAKAAAKKVFKNVAKPGRKYIVLEDLLRFLSESEANKALTLFEGATEFGKITKKGLVVWVTSVYRERRSLALSLNDTKTAVNKLHQIINAVVCIVIVIIWLLVLGLATSHLLVVVSSQLLLIVFVFGNTCKTVFEAIIFLFVMHPFDVGDRCVIDGVQMIVEEMNILTTVFLRYDNEKIYYPNSVLSNKPISNFYRSPDMGDAIEFTVHMSTPVEKIALLKDRVRSYIDIHTHHWHAKHTIVVKEIEDMNKMKMALWLQHTMNHQNAGERWIRRSELLLNLKAYFEELGIEYHLLPQEISIKTFPSAPSQTLV